MYRTFKYRVYPSEGQLKKLAAWEDACRYLWNLCLEQWKLWTARPKGERRYPKYFDVCTQITDLRKEVPWLKDVPRNVLCHVPKALEESWKRCFERLSKAPRFKRKGRDHMSFTEPDHNKWKLDAKRNLISFPKLGNLRAKVSRPLEGRPLGCTLKRLGAEWYITIQCELPDPPPTSNRSVVGLDRGIVLLVADSDGASVPNPQFFKQSLVQLRRVQRKASRKVKGSANQKKAYARVAKVHRRVTRRREHYLHQISKFYSKSHGVVGVEGLQIGNMVKASRAATVRAELQRDVLDIRVIDPASGRPSKRELVEADNLVEALKRATLFFAAQRGLAEFAPEHLKVSTGSVDYLTLREALVNQIVHQDYTDATTAAQIELNDEKVTVFNAGASLVPTEHLLDGGKSQSRNPLIARALRSVGFAEISGSGIRAVHRACQQAQRKSPTFESNEKNNTFTLTLDWSVPAPEDVCCIATSSSTTAYRLFRAKYIAT